MVGGNVGDIEALHHARRGAESEFFRQFRQILGGSNRRGHAASPAELAGGRQGFFQILQHIAQGRRAFEIEVFRRLRHFLAQAVEDLAFALSLHDPAGVLHPLEVCLTGDAAHAGRGAVADDVRVAVPVVLLAGHRRPAHAQAEAAVQPIQRLMQRAGMGKRAEVTRAVVLLHPRGGKTRPWITQADPG